MSHQQLIKRVYSYIMENATNNCNGCRLELANQLGHSCLMAEDDLILEQLPLAINQILSYDELALLTSTYISELVLKYGRRARRRRADYNSQRPDLNNREDPTGYWRDLFDSAGDRLETIAPELPVEVIDLTGDDVQDEEATQSPSLFLGSNVDPAAFMSVTCPPPPSTPESTTVVEEVTFNLTDEATLRGFADPFSEEEEEEKDDEDDDKDEDTNHPAVHPTEASFGRFPSIEAQPLDWWWWNNDIEEMDS